MAMERDAGRRKIDPVRGVPCIQKIVLPTKENRFVLCMEGRLDASCFLESQHSYRRHTLPQNEVPNRSPCFCFYGGSGAKLRPRASF